MEHPGELVTTDIGTEALRVEIDPGSPNRVQFCLTEEGEYIGGLYVDPAEAHLFADAINAAASEAEGKDRHEGPRTALDALIADLQAHEKWEGEPAEYRNAGGSWADLEPALRRIRGML